MMNDENTEFPTSYDLLILLLLAMPLLAIVLFIVTLIVARQTGWEGSDNQDEKPGVAAWV
jgi:hypothetical protein